MYTVTTSLISPEGMPDVKAEKSEPMYYGEAQSLFFKECFRLEQMNITTTFFTDKVPYVNIRGKKWSVTLEVVG